MCSTQKLHFVGNNWRDITSHTLTNTYSLRGIREIVVEQQQKLRDYHRTMAQYSSVFFVRFVRVHWVLFVSIKLKIIHHYFSVAFLLLLFLIFIGWHAKALDKTWAKINKGNPFFWIAAVKLSTFAHARARSLARSFAWKRDRKRDLLCDEMPTYRQMSRIKRVVKRKSNT